MEKIIKYIITTILVLVVGYGCWLFLRVTTFDYFTIPSPSMYPTLKPGDKVIVNKLLMGARIYTELKYDPNGCELKSFRIKGLRSVKHDDIVVFNNPNHSGRISFIMNEDMCKRVIAIPGDSLSIVHGIYRNNNYKKIFGFKKEQQRLFNTPNDQLYPMSLQCYPFDGSVPWTIKEFGPFYIPRKGDVIRLTPREAVLYRMILAWETGKEITWNWQNGKVYANGKTIGQHIFMHNYYFVAGDNVMDSDDSRYWGLLPEEYIIGIVAKVIHAN